MADEPTSPPEEPEGQNGAGNQDGYFLAFGHHPMRDVNPHREKQAAKRAKWAAERKR